MTFVWDGEYGFSPWELVLFWGKDVEFKGKIMLHYFRGVKRQQDFTAGVGFNVYNVIGLTTEADLNGVVVNEPESNSNNPRSLPG